MKPRVLLSMALMLSAKGVNVSVPFLFKNIVDNVNFELLKGTSAVPSTEVDPHAPIDTLTSLTTSLSTMTMPTLTPTTAATLAVIGYGASRASASFLNESRNMVFAHVAQSAIRRVGSSTFEHLHLLDLNFHLKKNSGTVTRILERGNRSISFVLNAMVFNVLPTAVEVGVVSGLMYYNFGAMHLLCVGSTITSYVLFTVGVTQWRTAIRRDMNRLENEASGKAVDSLLNYETVKYFNNEAHEVQRYEKSLIGYQAAATKTQVSLGALNFGQNAIFSVGLSAIMYLTLQDVMAGAATVGDLVLVNGLLFQLSIPLNFIGSVYREVKQALIDMESMFTLKQTVPEVRDEPDSVDYEPTNEASSHNTAITFDNVTFSYPTTDRPVINSMSFSIDEGQTVAFVGNSGCGKSTILRLLYRFYDVHQKDGRISFGGENVRNLTADSFRKAIAVIPQDIVLFNDTIEYNINYGNWDRGREEVVEAAKKAKIHETILSFPEGYDTVVGERGLKLSGGEKQRVSIARAILKDAPILFCDEPTSSLDSETEGEIMEGLKEVGEEVTTIIIAHRLSTIQDADKIFFLEKGAVAEEGSHAELMRIEGGKYKAAYLSQIK